MNSRRNRTQKSNDCKTTALLHKHGHHNGLGLSLYSRLKVNVKNTFDTMTFEPIEGHLLQQNCASGN